MLFASSLFSAATAENKEDSVKAMFDQAISLSEHGDWSGAEQLFKKISLDHPDWPEPKNNLAVALFNLGKIEQAQQALEDAVTSLPAFKVAQENRKRLYDHSAAVAYLKAIGEHEEVLPPQLQILHEVNSPLFNGQAEAQVKEVSLQAPDIEVAAEKIEPEPEPEPEQLISSVIEQAVMLWSKAWSDADIDQYLSAYSSSFRSSDQNTDYTQWRNTRRAKFRISNGIRIDLQGIKIYLHDNESEAVAEFVQHYQSNKYQDKVVKQLYLVLENEHWLIRSERVLQQLH